MASGGEMRHLTSERIQEFLDRRLTPLEEASVGEHLAVCPRCQSEAEGWRLLFSDLADLPELDPGSAFSEVVLGSAPVREGALSRPRHWLAARSAERREGAHIPSASIQDYLEGLLPAHPSSRVEAHLTACASCQEEVREWKSLMGSLQPLSHFAPGSAFAERVMAQVTVPAPVPARSGRLASLPVRVLAWSRSLLPRTRHGWAVAAGVASAPTITMVTLVYLLFSRPLLTLGNFGSYFLWKASALLGTVLSSVSALVMESETLFQLYSLLQTLGRSPFLLGLGGLVFSLVSAAALWVLYRNLFVNTPDDRYARARV